METRYFTLEHDKLPLCVVGRFDGQQPGLFLPASTVTLLQQALSDAKLRDQVTGERIELAETALLGLLEQVLSAYLEAPHSNADKDIKQLMWELKRLAREIEGGGDGPDRA